MAIERAAVKSEIRIIGSHTPARNRTGRIDVALDHNWLAMVRRIMTMDRVDQRALSNTALALDMTTWANLHNQEWNGANLSIGLSLSV